MLHYKSVLRCKRSTINFYNPNTGKYHILDNVLLCKNSAISTRNRTGTLESSRSNSREFQDIGYCLKKKLSSTIHGSVFKGLVVKRMKTAPSCNISSKGNTATLGSIQEDVEVKNISRFINEFDFLGDESIYEPTPKSIIIKISSWERIRSLRGKHLKDPLKEVQAMQYLGLGKKHPNIISNEIALQDDTFLYNIMPLCRDGDIGGIIMSDITAKGRMSEHDARHWFRQILIILHDLQCNGVCHRSITLDNIVVHHNVCKLIDFGLALRIPYEHPIEEYGTTDVSDGTKRRLIISQGQSGDLTYMSPEVFSEDSRFDGFAVDLWSAGVILYIMLIGSKPFKLPFPTDTNFDRICMDCKLKDCIDYWGIDLSVDAIDLCQNMLVRDKRKRLTLAAVMKHPWVVADAKQAISEKDSKSSSSSSINSTYSSWTSKMKIRGREKKRQ